jgi:hypothetical protein
VPPSGNQGEAHPHHAYTPPPTSNAPSSIPPPQNIYTSPHPSNPNISYTGASVDQEANPTTYPTFSDSEKNISLSEFETQFPKYSTLLPHIYNTATTLSLVLDDNHDWLTQSEPGKPPRLLGYARLAIEAVVKSHLSKPNGVDITHEGKFRVAALFPSKG